MSELFTILSASNTREKPHIFRWLKSFRRLSESECNRIKDLRLQPKGIQNSSNGVYLQI